MGSVALILLDTHAWVWWVARPTLLSPAARREIETAVEQGEVNVSAISCWEVSLLVERGRLELAMVVEEWIARSEALPFLEFLPVDHRIATRANSLPGELHADPADRLIVATALLHGLPLVTKDRRLRRYRHIETVW